MEKIYEDYVEAKKRDGCLDDEKVNVNIVKM